ncbi:hypothetical protein SmJEL517_g01607 [Synchytrium microbalum]|uniref:non-specific serine/threonine protein kinase n=1 Tax=Synchytrium microbalum TaxID=1806994 RepID=A0A507C3S8_9FUNG|nr:uncharacterized protein SmJEL517_g01607 [Synchytrium microbalum]TPX36190.1 hypothetical protein SmJEL517_g01607 [Synchytrium microbalum]
MSGSNAVQIRVGNYTLLETLGVGSFGKVKLAVHSQTNHKVAVKIVNRRRIASMDMVGRIKREIQYLKLLRHPHIIKLYEVITTPTDIIMVMEYAGGELFNYIVERGRMTEDDARRFFQQIICAVEFCHRHKIVHRDLKPENVLLDEYNNVKIADFGLSNVMADGDFLKTSCGSPNYAAPEVISGRLYAGPEVDVWSCGVILYVMLCGRLPFDDDYIPNLFKKINGGIFTLPSFLSPSTRQLLSAMLTVDPLKRITIADIRKLDWFNVGLPDYLQPLPDAVYDPLIEIDPSIVGELQKKMGFSKETINWALGEADNNQIKVAYQLVVDYRRMMQGAHAQQQQLKNLKAFSIPGSPSWSARSDTDEHQSHVQLISSSLVKRSEALKDSSSVQPKRHKGSRWHFGIRSRSPPLDIMLEIYRALRNCNMKWKSIDPFHIRAKHTSPNGQQVKLDIQLYRVEQGSYLVDFKNSTPYVVVSSPDDEAIPKFVTGSVYLPPPEGPAGGAWAVDVEANLSSFAFFDACCKLITELAISA